MQFIVKIEGKISDQRGRNIVNIGFITSQRKGERTKGKKRDIVSELGHVCAVYGYPGQDISARLGSGSGSY